MSQSNVSLNEVPPSTQQNSVPPKIPSGPASASFISNGQPNGSEWGTFPTADLNKMPSPGSTNGTPLHNPPSLSSHSSRDPSPGAYRYGDNNNTANNSPYRIVNGLIDPRSKFSSNSLSNNGLENISPLSSSHSSAQHSPALPQQHQHQNPPPPLPAAVNFPKNSIPLIRPTYPQQQPSPSIGVPQQSQNLLMQQQQHPIMFNQQQQEMPKKSESPLPAKQPTPQPSQQISYITPLNVAPPTVNPPFNQTAFNKPRAPTIPMMSRPPIPPQNSQKMPPLPTQTFIQPPPSISSGQEFTPSSSGPYSYNPPGPAPPQMLRPPPMMSVSQAQSLPPPSTLSQSMPHLNQPHGPLMAPPPSQQQQQQQPHHLHQSIQPPPLPPPTLSQSQYIHPSQVTAPPPPPPPSGGMPPHPTIQNKPYPQNRTTYPGNLNDHQLAQNMGGLSITNTGFNRLWGIETVDLLQTRNVLPPEPIEPPKIRLNSEHLDEVNCSTEIFRCTLTKIPETNSLLQKSRLPLGILIHPYKDLSQLPVIQCATIVRCRACRTYINPFVSFVDHKRWKCNLCFRINDLPDEFQYDPVSKTYGDPTRRPEVRSSTIEFIAPTEYMLRPPQPAVYLFALDVSRLACESGYLRLVCETLLTELDTLPGDGRTQIGFLTYASSVHFYNLAERLNQPQQMQVLDIQDVFVPYPDNLLVNLKESRELVRELLRTLPKMFEFSGDTNSCLGAALQAAYKLMSSTGGRVSVFQCCLTNSGPGALTAREDPSQRAGHDSPHLNPATDFYKRLALECSGQQIAVDLWLLNAQYSDLATLSGISRFSGGCLYHFPIFRSQDLTHQTSFQSAFRRYLSRKIGFEAVMRIRCSRGLTIHTFHGNFFVRSTDLLSLPNVNPDAGFGMQVSIDESLADLHHVCFQAALLYTSSKGERRIRVHTLCLPIASILSDILLSADQQCIVGLLAKMAVDRSQQSSLTDARDAFINVAVDVLSAYKLLYNQGPAPGLLAPSNLCLLPLYILALLKHPAFRAGTSTRLDDRLFAMCQMKSLPLPTLIQSIYPDLYPVPGLSINGEQTSSIPPRLHLSAEKMDSRGAYVMDCGENLILFVCQGVESQWCQAALAASSPEQLPEPMLSLPELETPESETLRNFISLLQKNKPYEVMIEVIRDSSPLRKKFIDRLIEDRTESALSYYEFLQHLKSNIK